MEVIETDVFESGDDKEYCYWEKKVRIDAGQLVGDWLKLIIDAGQLVGEWILL